MTALQRLGSAVRPALVALAAGLLLLAVGLEGAGYSAGPALAALWRGAFGSPDAIFSSLLPRAIPLIIIGLGIGLAFRAGAFNIGAEGQFYAGAIVATWVGLALGGWPRAVAVPVVLITATLAGMAWAAVPALLRVRFGVLEVISTLLLNFVAEALVSWMVVGPLQEARHVYPQSDPLPLAARLPQLPGTRLHLGLALALLLALGLWVLGRWTLAGLRLRAVGLNPDAAETMGGVRPLRVLALALIASGACAGLAGGSEVSGTTFALFQNLSPGYGFTGIAVALLARLHPLGTVLTGLLFAALEAGAGAMQRDAGVPAVAVYVVEAVVILIVVLSDVAARRGDTRGAV
ncbi:MAG: ABC transporter permease [Gemmatimonadetes bacterium]|nr:ABC transporter permease [Gemmatimonadota bacterium]MBK7351577.1 ABC transporter permease [Gemmatimonadota bacterium]MBK7716949.1 ABC transporter permease [Gemmatimonadota bacterium]MBK7786736.1 ABC transporter permease [Gemmatimonadota bacterium]MBK9066144.1 ABC transporter permease [Gemmatimonadota bacterium]